MNNRNALEIAESEHLKAPTLWEGLFEYGSPQNKEAYASINNVQTVAPKANSGFFGHLQALSSNISQVQSGYQQSGQALSNLCQDILNLIRHNELIAYGFKAPRDLTDNRIKIPADIFHSAEINWEKSELKYKDMEFTSIRLLKNSENQEKEIKPDKLEIAVSKNKKPNKSNFADLPDEQYIDEKMASEFLGISPRTLQGYRVKGGGPEFLKMPKAVRYMKAQLLEWATKNKKENTSQKEIIT